MNGRSRELGIAFETTGGAKWCGPAVTVRLTAPQAEAFALDHPPFTVMLARIRALLVEQCADAELITFDGVVARQRVFLAETSRLTQWTRFVGLDPETQQPVCAGASPDPTECGKRLAAYATAKNVLRGPAFEKAAIVTFLDTGAADHLAWQTPAMTGKLQLTHPNELATPFESTAKYADSVIAQSRDACLRANGRAGAIASSDYPGDLSYRSFGCQPASGQPYQLSMLIASRDGWYYAVSLRGEGANTSAVDEAASQLLQSVAAQ